MREPEPDARAAFVACLVGEFLRRALLRLGLAPRKPLRGLRNETLEETRALIPLSAKYTPVYVIFTARAAVRSRQKCSPSVFFFFFIVSCHAARRANKPFPVFVMKHVSARVFLRAHMYEERKKKMFKDATRKYCSRARL